MVADLWMRARDEPARPHRLAAHHVGTAGRVGEEEVSPRLVALVRHATQHGTSEGATSMLCYHQIFVKGQITFLP